MAKFTIAILGAGPRALNLIERLAWRLSNDPSLPALDVHLVDPGQPCAGVHPTDQSRHLLTNTLASQVTMFSSVDPEDPLSGPSGPSFTEWADAAGYRRFGSEYRRDAGGERIGDLDYLPRALLGEYLVFAFGHVMKHAPERLQVTHHRELAVDASEEPCFAELASGKRIYCDALVIATGHCETNPTEIDLDRMNFVRAGRAVNPRLDYMRSAYPTSRFGTIEPSSVVAIQGLGLTAYDVVAELTTGRGGRFEGTVGNLRYISSGDEPKLVMFSRESLPYNARGVNQKGVDGGHRARFLTTAAVRAIRAKREAELGDGRIDFEAEIVPLLRKDMAWAYRAASEGKEPRVESFELSPEEEVVIDRIIRPSHVLGSASFAEFRKRVVEHLREDLAEALKGNVVSPLKAATDTIRDLRAGLAAAIEYGGLLPASHRHVCERFIALTNRITFGPPLLRNAELLALCEAGVVDWAGGPGAEAGPAPEGGCWNVRTPFPSGLHVTKVDVLVIARVFGHRPNDDARALSPRLVKRRIARPFRNGDYHPYGLDIDRRMRVVRADGTPSDRIWAVGYVTEGARFHTHALPRPRRSSTQLTDAARLVDDMLAAVCRLQRAEKVQLQAFNESVS
jgi:uncharacterized NAD(P)/FAD-binding protein YdhS